MACHYLMVYGAQNLNRKGSEDRGSFLEAVSGAALKRLLGNKSGVWGWGSRGPECSMWGEQRERVWRGAVSLEQNIWVRS